MYHAQALYLPHHYNARRMTAMLLSYKNDWSSFKWRQRDVLPCPRMCRGTCFSSFGPSLGLRMHCEMEPNLLYVGMVHTVLTRWATPEA